MCKWSDNMSKFYKQFPIYTLLRKLLRHTILPNVLKNRLIDWLTDWLILFRFNDMSTLWVILCRLLEKGRNEIEEIVEEMKERDREDKRAGMKVKKQK